jgi:hypothetical protein
MGGDKPMTWEQSLVTNYTDAILVLHKGKIVYQRYFGIMTPDQPHIMWSGTKSYFGLLGAILIAKGKLDENANVAAIIPELKDTGFSDATVRQVADQTTNLAYTASGQFCRRRSSRLTLRSMSRKSRSSDKKWSFTRWLGSQSRRPKICKFTTSKHADSSPSCSAPVTYPHPPKIGRSAMRPGLAPLARKGAPFVHADGRGDRIREDGLQQSVDTVIALDCKVSVM